MRKQSRGRLPRHVSHEYVSPRCPCRICCMPMRRTIVVATAQQPDVSYCIAAMRSFLIVLLFSFSASARSAFVPRSSQATLPGKTTYTNLSSDANHEEQNEDVPAPMETRGGASKLKLPKLLPPMPTMAAYRNFALPCLGLWISQPLLSLVDTAFVGLSGSPSMSASNLAALGPATTFIDGATYLFVFLNVATTNLYASARAQAGEDSPKAESVVRTSARIALRSGMGLMIFLLAVCRPLLALYIGPEASASPGLLDAAVDYVRIRALSMPTSLVLGVLQSALLGAKDSVTPLIAILYCTVVNVIGDFILVNRFGMGLQGAAIATTLAQWASTAALVAPAKRELVKDGRLEIWRKKTVVEGGVSGRAFLGFAAPVLTLILGKLAAFGFMTHSAAALPGQPITLATHQIILSLFFFVSPFLEVISQTAQTFLPPYLAPVTDYIISRKEMDSTYDASKDVVAKEWLDAAFSVSTRLLRLGMGVGCVAATAASMIPAFFGGALSSDAAVQEAVKPLAPYLFAGCLLTAPVAVSEGVLLAGRELKYLASVYVISTLLLPQGLLRIKKLQGPVTQVWGAFAAFQLFRAICFTGRIWGVSFVKKFSTASVKVAEEKAS